MNIIFKYVQNKCEPMKYEDVKYNLDEMCRDLEGLGVSGRLRIHNRIMNELGGKQLPIDQESTWRTERRYQALLNARNMLDEFAALMQLSLPKEQVLEQKRQETANDSGKKRKAKFQLRLTEVLAILGGGFLGALLTRILFG